MLEHTFLKQVYVPTFPLYLALFDAGSNELAGQPGYARVVTWPADWGLVIGGQMTNEQVYHFPEATGDWTQAVNGFGFYDSNNDLFSMDILDTPQTIVKGDIPTFVPGALTIHLADYQMSIDYGVPGHNAFSNYLKEKWLKHLFGIEPYTPPDIWVGLCLSDPGDYLTNTNCDEVLGNGTGYSRTYVDPMDWTVLMAEAWNNAKITFDEATVLWGTVKHFALFDTYSPLYAGNALFHGPVEPWKIVIAGSIPSFDITIPVAGTGNYSTLGIGFAIL